MKMIRANDLDNISVNKFQVCHFFGSKRKSFTFNFRDFRYGSNFTSSCVFLKVNSCATIAFSHAIIITPPPIIEYGFDFFANFSPATLSQNLYKLLRVIAFLTSFLPSNSSTRDSVVTKSVYNIFFTLKPCFFVLTLRNGLF